MLELKLVSPSKLVLDEQALKVEIPGALGYLCVGVKHTPFLSELKPGIVQVYLQDQKNKKAYYVSGGYFQVEDNNAVVLADIVESYEEVDLNRAKASKERAQKRLSETSNSRVDIQRALNSLSRAEARLALKQLSF